LPADWAPDADLADWTRQNAPNVDAKRELSKFRDFWAAKPGKDGRKLDWPATWRNWIRRAAESSPGNVVALASQPGGGRRAL